jgi:hypothetical protein
MSGFLLALLLLGPGAALADDEQVATSARARKVAITGASMSGAGMVLLGTSAALALGSRNDGGCVDWCGNMGLVLASGGVGAVLLVPGAVITLAGATRMNALDRKAGRRASALPVALGWGLAGLGVATFGAGAYVATADLDGYVSPDPFIYGGLGLFAGAAGAGMMQLGVRGDGGPVAEVGFSPTTSGGVVFGRF